MTSPSGRARSASMDTTLTGCRITLLVEAIVGRRQFFAASSFHQPQGIDIRMQVPQHPVGHDQALDARLRLCTVLRKARLLPGHGLARRMLESVEKAAPLWRNTLRRILKRLVKLIDILRIRTAECGGASQRVQGSVHLAVR